MEEWTERRMTRMADEWNINCSSDMIATRLLWLEFSHDVSISEQEKLLKQESEAKMINVTNNRDTAASGNIKFTIPGPLDGF